MYNPTLTGLAKRWNTERPSAILMPGQGSMFDSTGSKLMLLSNRYQFITPSPSHARKIKHAFD